MSIHVACLRMCASVLFYFSFVCLHVCAYASKCEVHWGVPSSQALLGYVTIAHHLCSFLMHLARKKCDGKTKKKKVRETPVKQQWNPSLPNATLVCKKIKEEKPRRRRRTCRTREPKCFPFPSLKQYWTGSCWPVCQCDEFRLIWECEVCRFEIRSSDLNSHVTWTRQSTRSRQWQS